MNLRRGFTLIEMIVVLVIIGVVFAITLPNFTNPTEQARALIAKNNLLSIYTAQKNYFNNNNGTYCYDTGVATSCGHSLANLNTNLGLNIQDDGSYTYSCSAGSCTALRSNASVTITATLNIPIQLTVAPVNPTCVATNASWCP